MNNFTKNTTSTIVIIAFLAACGGRTANPVTTQQYGDPSKSCEAIRIELSQIDSDVARLIPESNKTAKNAALGVAGWFLIVPWFFMDLSQAEKTEIEAYKKRYTYLSTLAADKKCK